MRQRGHRAQQVRRDREHDDHARGAGVDAAIRRLKLECQQTLVSPLEPPVDSSRKLFKGWGFGSGAASDRAALTTVLHPSGDCSDVAGYSLLDRGRWLRLGYVHSLAD